MVRWHHFELAAAKGSFYQTLFGDELHLPACTFPNCDLQVNLDFPLPLLLLLPLLVAGFPAPQGYSEEKEYPDIEPKYEDGDFANNLIFNVIRYQYQYAVTDDYTKSNFQAEEERDGFSTLGSYRWWWQWWGWWPTPKVLLFTLENFMSHVFLIWNWNTFIDL